MFLGVMSRQLRKPSWGMKVRGTPPRGRWTGSGWAGRNGGQESQGRCSHPHPSLLGAQSLREWQGFRFQMPPISLSVDLP